MNKVLLNILLNDQNNELWHDHKSEYQYIFLNDSIQLFEDLFYPYIEKLEEKEQLNVLAENLSEEQKEILLGIPEQLVLSKAVQIIKIIEDDENECVLEFRCFERIIKSYKHPVFFELLNLISIHKEFSLKKENHQFGHHFHLYEKTQRTATLLTFDPSEQPFEKADPAYDTFNHSLYYEPHSKGATSKGFQDINSKNSKFKSNLYNICRDIVVNKTYKSDFKKQSSTKSILYLP